MEQMISELGREDLYILLFLIVAVLAGIVVFAVFLRGIRKSNRADELRAGEIPEPPPESMLPGMGANPGVDRTTAQSGRERGIDVVTQGPSPGDDIPADLAARPLGGLKEDPSVRVHTLEEIQRKEPKSLDSALANTRSSFFGRIKSIFGSKPAISSTELDELEEILYTSDLGPQTVQRLLDAVNSRIKSDGSSGFEAVRLALKNEMIGMFDAISTDGAAHSDNRPNGSALPADGRHLHVVKPAVTHGSEAYIEGLESLDIWDHKPAVIMVVGVNGAGKTTTIGKLARRIAQSGRKVLVAAGDTFRAAAGDQLKVWTERAQVEIYSPEGVTDPSAVAFKACEEAQARGFDVVIVDTAGRLHTQKNLMEELKKMKRVISKPIPSGPHEVLLVLDANSGQNALIQAREFHQALEVTGVVLTKLDGTAKGGVALGLAYELKLPIKLIGVGEGVDDLRRFSSREFVDSII
jgi:fused signal recognition particle receptor